MNSKAVDIGDPKPVRLLKKFSKKTMKSTEVQKPVLRIWMSILLTNFRESSCKNKKTQHWNLKSI